MAKCLLEEAGANRIPCYEYSGMTKICPPLTYPYPN